MGFHSDRLRLNKLVISLQKHSLNQAKRSSLWVQWREVFLLTFWTPQIQELWRYQASNAFFVWPPSPQLPLVGCSLLPHRLISAWTNIYINERSDDFPSNCEDYLELVEACITDETATGFVGCELSLFPQNHISGFSGLVETVNAALVPETFLFYAGLRVLETGKVFACKSVALFLLIWVLGWGTSFHCVWHKNNIGLQLSCTAFVLFSGYKIMRSYSRLSKANRDLQREE